MAFFFTCGTHTFTSLLKGHEDLTLQCQNCGNHSAKVFKRWFTLCFVPIIPFSIKPWTEVGCHICNFFQDVKYRPDVQGLMAGGSGGGGAPPQQSVPLQQRGLPTDARQGWGQAATQGPPGGQKGNNVYA